MKRLLAVAVLGLWVNAVQAQSTATTLSLEDAVATATASDPWLRGSAFRQQALTEEAIAAASLPDPRLSLMAGNFPVDSFDINQEPMTQLSVGISQMFPRGDSLELGRRQKEQLSEQEPLLRQDRRARVTSSVTQLWLEAYRAQESIRLIESDRALFDYLVDAARSNYASALGGARQQDLIRAQLELTRLDDRLSELHLHYESAQQQLAEWVGQSATLTLRSTALDDLLPIDLETLSTQLRSDQQAYALLEPHPALRAIDKRIDAMDTGVELEQQKYKPDWGLSAQYGYRDDDLMGRERADLFSVGISVDLPLFTGNRQDKAYAAAVARTEALKTDKLLLARQLLAQLQSAVARLRRLDQRETLYTSHLLPQMAEQAEAALSAYNNDVGDFAEAVRARIAELDAKIDALSLAVERQQTTARINYLLAGAGAGQDFVGEEQ
jgi:outer membrane protein TolC